MNLSKIDLRSHSNCTLSLLTFIFDSIFLHFSMEEKTAIGQCWCHEGARSDPPHRTDMNNDNFCSCLCVA